MIKHWHWYQLPDGTRVLSSKQYQGHSSWRWAFYLPDDTPAYFEDMQRRGRLVRLLPEAAEPGAYRVVPSDLVLEDLCPTGEYLDGWEMA